MTRMRPWRRITRHFSHIFFTLGRTFTWTLLSLVSIGDPTSGEVVWGEFNLNLVARQDTDVVHPHLSGDVGQNLVAVFEFDAEHRVRERLGDRSFQDDCVFLRLCQWTLLMTAGTTPLDELCAASACLGYDTGRPAMLSAVRHNTTRCPPAAGDGVLCASRCVSTALDDTGEPLKHVVGIPHTVHNGQLAEAAVVLDQRRGLRLVQIETPIHRIGGVIIALGHITTADIANPWTWIRP